MTVDNRDSEMDFQSFNCTDNFSFTDHTKETKSVFKLTDNFLEVMIDSTEISKMLSDSLGFQAETSFNGIIKLIKFPYSEDEEWDVTSLKVNVGFANLSLISITGKYQGSEFVNLPELGIETVAEKFSYDGKLNLPNINNPFVNTLKEFNANLWFAEDLGIVKMEGFSLFINTIIGSGFNFPDTNKIVRHSLVGLK